MVFRKHFLQPETIAIIPPHGYRPKDKQSVQALKWITYLAEKNSIYIKHAKNAGEQQIGPYKVDGFHEETNTVYEYYGDFWHACKHCFAPTTKNPVTNCTMQALYERTIQRRKYLMDEGYTVVEKWECVLNKELKGNEEMKACFENMTLAEPLEPRQALFGGRTKLFHECGEGEKIKYVDFIR